MPNSNYKKGYRFEKKCQAWLVHLGECVRAFGSRGDDLVLTHGLRRWTFSCKARKSSPCKLIDDELEKHDGFIWGYDRGIPIIAMPLPKFVEFCGEE